MGTDTVDATIAGLPDLTTLGGILPVESGGTGISWTDPNADRILFWDDSAGAFAGLTAGSGLSISGTTITATGSGTVTPSTAGSGAPNVLTAAQSGSVITNEGTTAENYNTLPAAAAGLEFTFVCQDADGIRATAAAGDTIRIAGSVSAAAGFCNSTTIGSVVTLLAINATEWIATSVTGTWGVT